MTDHDEEGSYEDDSIEDESTLIEKEASECFAVFDPRNTGLMPSKFFKKALQSLGIQLTATELEDLLKKYDKEGFIELPDFTGYATEKLAEIEAPVHLKTAFAAFDFENEGVLPADRFKKWMTTLGSPLTDSETKELYKLGDPGNKGLFNYEDAIPRLLY